jgi:hypothetical protein
MTVWARFREALAELLRARRAAAAADRSSAHRDRFWAEVQAGEREAAETCSRP